MKNTHQNYLYMCQNVKKFYRQNEVDIDQFKSLSNLFINLSTLVDRLKIEFYNSISYSNGFSIERARKRENLQNHCLALSSNLIFLRDSIKYKPIEQLSAFVDYDFVELSVLNEEDLLDYASNVYDLVLLCEPRLKIQGLRQKKIDVFVSALTLYALDYPMNKYSIELRKEASLNSLKAYSDLNEYFLEKLDPAMQVFDIKNPTLYNDYQEARKIIPFDIYSKATFEGQIKDGDVHSIANLKYDRDREIRVSVTGGNAIWGISNKLNTIEYCRPINSREKINLFTRLIGPEGDLLMIQSVNPDQIIDYKIWINES